MQHRLCMVALKLNSTVLRGPAASHQNCMGKVPTSMYSFKIYKQTKKKWAMLSISLNYSSSENAHDKHLHIDGLNQADRISAKRSTTGRATLIAAVLPHSC